jgi:hypothetical protein
VSCKLCNGTKRVDDREYEDLSFNQWDCPVCASGKEVLNKAAHREKIESLRRKMNDFKERLRRTLATN